VRWFVAAVLLVAVLAACGGDDEEEPVPSAPSVAGFEFEEGAVAEGEPIDARYTCEGEDVSPELAWTGVPEGAAELILVVEDPDAPGGTFTHWLAFGIDPGETGMAEGAEGLDLAQGENDMGEIGYGGPCPPEGETHDYVFRLLAVDAESGLDDGASRDDVLAAVEGHVLGEAILTAPYSRG
jgi:Raf kinase inhibitor-like YbhB/YbcL family protein